MAKLQAFVPFVAAVSLSIAGAVWLAVGGAHATSVERAPHHPERYALADRGPDVPLTEAEWAQVHEEGLAGVVLRVGCARKATPPPHPTVGCPWLPGLETPRAPRRHDVWSTPLAEAVESLRGVHDGGTPNRAVMFWRHRVFALVADLGRSLGPEGSKACSATSPPTRPCDGTSKAPCRPAASTT